MKKGKDKCEILKMIRKYVAKKYGLDYEPSECTHEGSCMGSCLKCDEELYALQKQLENKGIDSIASDKTLQKLVEEFADMSIEEVHDSGIVGMMKEFNMPDDPSPIESPNGRVFLECRVAGTSYHHVDDMLDTIFVGRKVHLMRDRDNKHDENAVAVSLNDPSLLEPEDLDFSDILGYVPREDNAALASMMDMGWERAFDAYISKINPKSEYEKLRITITIKSKEDTLREEKEESKGLFRAMSLSPGQWGALEMDLYEEGMAYYRWCCLPTFDHDLPEKGERILFFSQEDDGSYRLYLMMVLAVDEECYPFVKGKHEIIMKDDCCPFVLTNIKGPVSVGEEVMDEILKGKAETFSWGPEQKLSKAATLRIKEILGIDD